MAPSQVTPDQAVELHRDFLRDVLDDVLRSLESGEPGVERLCRALVIYWEGCFERRDVRRAVIAATSATELQRDIEPMGRPFSLMIRSELVSAARANVDQLARKVYDGARAIAVQEAQSGQRQTLHREQVLQQVRTARSSVIASVTA